MAQHQPCSQLTSPSSMDANNVSASTAPTETDVLQRQWERPSSVLGRILYSTLCLIAFGYPSMDHIRETLYDPNEKSWEEGISQLYIRLSNVLMGAGFILATAIPFITTSSPKDSGANYNQRGTYICIVASFGLIAGGIIVGSSALIVLSRLQRRYAINTFCADKFRTFCTLVMLAYPAIAVAVAVPLLAMGLLSAAWTSKDVGIQGASIIVLLLPCTMPTIFFIACCAKKQGICSEIHIGARNNILPV